MKRILVAVVAILVISLGFNAYSQEPRIQLSFDNGGTQWWSDCPSALGIDTLTVWTVNFDMWMNAIEYMIEYDPVLTFIDDLMIGDALPIGNSPTGITIAYPSPGESWGMFAVQRVVVFWNSNDCSPHPDTPITIVPHPVTGKIRAVRWPDLGLIDAEGGTSYICPTLNPAQETTWGAVKSLYER